MTDVGVASVGQTPFTTEPVPILDLLVDAAASALAGTEFDHSSIDCVLVSTNDTTRYLGAVLAQTAGIRPRAAQTVESMCSSGGSAIVSAYSYIKSGLARTVLVAGAERPRSPGNVLEWDVSRGQFRSPIYWASIMTKSYKRRYGVSPERLAAVAAKNRRLAMDNPDSLGGGRYSVRDVLESREITEDLRLLDCSRSCSGSAAVLLADGEMCRSITDRPVWIRGLGQDTGPAGFGGYAEHHVIGSVRRAADRAYGMAGIRPDMVDVAEVHDAFSVCEPMILEALGMAPAGGGADASYEMYRTGSRRVNPRGGLLGAGHPLGATGVAQAVEVARQLRGEAGRRQVEGAGTGMTVGMSAAGTSSVALVMETP